MQMPMPRGHPHPETSILQKLKLEVNNWQILPQNRTLFLWLYTCLMKHESNTLIFSEDINRKPFFVPTDGTYVWTEYHPHPTPPTHNWKMAEAIKSVPCGAIGKCNKLKEKDAYYNEHLNSSPLLQKCLCGRGAGTPD